MADISKLAVKVSADGSGVKAGMDAASAALKTGAADLAAQADKTGKKLNPFGDMTKKVFDFAAPWEKFAERAFTDPGRVLNEKLIGNAATFAAKVPFIGTALSLPLQAVQNGIDFALDTFAANTDRIMDLGKNAGKLGMDIGQFQVISRVTGDSDAAVKALSKFQQKLADAQVSSDDARTSFTKFGMDGKALAEIFEHDASAAFAAVADRVRELPVALRSAFGREVFGKTGLEIMPALMKGSEEVAKQKGMIEKFGLGVDNGVFASIKRTQLAKKQLQGLWEGFGNQITIATAPALAVLSDTIGELPMGFAGLAETIINGVGTAALFVADIIDGWWSGDITSRIEPYWLEFKALALEAIDFVGDALESMLGRKWQSSAVGKVFGAYGLGAGIQLAPGTISGRGPGEGASEAAGRFRDQAEMKRFLFENAREANDYLESMFTGAELAEAKAEWGLEGFASKARNALEAFGKAYAGFKGKLADEPEKDPFAPYYDRLDKFKEATKGAAQTYKDSLRDLASMTRAADLANPFMGPVQPEMMDKVRDRWRADFLGDTPDLAAFAALQKLRDTGGQIQTAGAMEAGGREAFSAITKWQLQGTRSDVQEEIKALLEQQRVLQEEQVREGRAARMAFEKAAPLKVRKI